LGYLADDAAFSVMKSAKIFVFPSHEEGFGMAVLEAMVLGLPVVAWDLPVYREVFPVGLLRIPLGKISEFSAAVVKLFEDRALYNQTVTQSRVLSEQFDWDKLAANEGVLLENLVANQVLSSKGNS
jgi:glycosyltransferase involved in cell wall biosynthesis